MYYEAPLTDIMDNIMTDYLLASSLDAVGDDMDHRDGVWEDQV